MKKVLAVLFLGLCGCAGLTKGWVSTPEDRVRWEKEHAESSRADAQRKLNERVPFAQFHEPFPPTRFEAVTIMSGKPDRKYTEIGMLSTVGDNVEYLTVFMRMRAAGLGADAIINFQQQEIPSSIKTTGDSWVSISNGQDDFPKPTTGRVTYKQQLRGIAVKFD